MITLATDDNCVHVPDWVRDLSTFRRWVHSDELPEKARVHFLDGEVWVDMSMERIFSHNQVKNEYAFVLTGIAKTDRLGRYFPNGMLVTNVDANLSAGPDGTFVSRESLLSGLVQLGEDPEGGIELIGSPDMVLEILSRSSVQKDTVLLMNLYWRAGIKEYWLVDARGDKVAFDIFRHGPKGYVATRKQAGWMKSAVFGRSFKLTRQADDLGNPEYVLAVRPEGNGKV